MICEDCGLVCQERFIEEESEVRIFNDDPDSAQKIRTGPATNINIDSILGSGKQKNVREVILSVRASVSITITENMTFLSIRTKSFYTKGSN